MGQRRAEVGSERRVLVIGLPSVCMRPRHLPATGSTENGSVMGGAYWRENSDGTFTARESGGAPRRGGFSWLDLYLMGLATPDEVPDMFILRNLRREGPCTLEGEWECERFGPFAADKEIVTIEQVHRRDGSAEPAVRSGRGRCSTRGSCTSCCPGRSPTPN